MHLTRLSLSCEAQNKRSSSTHQYLLARSSDLPVCLSPKMSNLPLGDDLKSLFDDVTSGKQGGETIRAILVQSDNGILRLIDSLPEKGTDKEDFNNVLGKLFAKEPSKSGYALYRLDSKSPAGLYEWLNCAYRPEGAKVREKMQYSITQASLFQGLNEQHFLDTVYVSEGQEYCIKISELMMSSKGRHKQRILLPN